MSASTTRVTRRRVAELALLTLVWLAISTFVLARPVFAAQPPVGLRSADSFAVLAGSGITNTGLTTIDGDVGSFPTPSETGFASVLLHGTNHGGDPVTQAAKNDLAAAYGDAAGRRPATNLAAALGGTTLRAGVYANTTFGLAGTLTLDAKGDPDAEFIFQAGSTVIAEVNSRVLLRNGANPCNVTWKVGSSATFMTGAQFVGDVLAYASITAQTGAAFQGRLMASNAAVTLDSNTITNATCPVPAIPPTDDGVVTPVVPPGPSLHTPTPPAVQPGTTPPASATSISPTDGSVSPADGSVSPADGSISPAAGVRSSTSTATTGVDTASPRWALIDPAENLSAPSTPPALAFVGAPIEVLMRTAFMLLAASAAFSVILVARRRRHTARLA
jgi:hypothetical protein